MQKTSDVLDPERPRLAVEFATVDDIVGCLPGHAPLGEPLEHVDCVGSTFVLAVTEVDPDRRQYISGMTLADA